MLHPRFWRLQTQVIALAGGMLALAAVGIAFKVYAQNQGFREAVKQSAPTAGVVVASLSLLVTLLSVVNNWRRQRREATIKAWIDWSASSVEARSTWTREFGVEVLTRQQAEELVRPGHRSEAAAALVLVLNGLERLAVGVQYGVYDLRTLRALGGTIFIRHTQRGKPYIDARRTHENPQYRQERAYVSLEYVSNLLELHARQPDVDKKRLSSLRRRAS